MQSNSQDFHKGILENIGINKHLLMGYLFLGLIFLGVVSAVYYWQYKNQMMIAEGDAARHVGSGEQVQTNGEPCRPGVVLAMNKLNSETREFSSICYVIPPWEKVQDVEIIGD